MARAKSTDAEEVARIGYFNGEYYTREDGEDSENNPPSRTMILAHLGGRLFEVE